VAIQAKQRRAEESRGPACCGTAASGGTRTPPAEQVRRKVVEQHDAGKNHPDKIRGWYNLAGGGAGFMLIETDDPRELTDLLQPYMQLVSWDVHAAYELPYEATVENYRKRLQEAS
jgi:hypothetical protein